MKILVLGIVKESNREIWCNPKTGPSDEWCRKFLKRHPELSERIPAPQDKARARMSNITVLRQYFDLLDKTTKELEIQNKPAQIFNCDESGFSGKEKSTEKVYVLKGAHAHQQRNLTNSHVTVHLCISGEGRVLPSFVIFQGGLPHRNFTDGVPSEWLYGSSESGYMDHDLFFKWFEGIFLSNCGVRRPVLLVMDNHDSHITLPFLKLAIANEITILGLPPHTTHILQPLDVGVFGPLKAKVTSLASKLGYLNTNAVVGKAKFPALLSTAIDQVCTPALIKSSFAKSGLYPVDIDAVDKTQIQPASVDPKASKESEKVSYSDDTEDDIQHVLCHECGTKLEVEQRLPTNPLVKMGIIPESLASILVPPPNTLNKKVKSSKVVTEARILTGQDVIKQLEEKEETARRQEEEKENRKVERIRKREEKERMVEERRLVAEEKKKERDRKRIDAEREKQRKKDVRERKKCRKENGLNNCCIICKKVDPGSERSEDDINWVQCGICDGWVHEVCSGVTVTQDEEYMCDECLRMFEE